MIEFPGCKINIGLNVLEKREDGFHEIQSIFYPVPWSDVVEVIHDRNAPGFTASGLEIQGHKRDNICSVITRNLDASAEVRMHLHKALPMGAGLGGGSADGAAVLKLLNEVLDWGKTIKELHTLAAQFGSDCPFFIDGTPQFVTGRGDILTDIDLDLSGYHILIVYPGIHVESKMAYEEVDKRVPDYDLRSAILGAPGDWKGVITNDFESAISRKHPVIREIKQRLYDLGAEYASMSGSGSAVYGIFSQEPSEWSWDSRFTVWKGVL